MSQIPSRQSFEMEDAMLFREKAAVIGRASQCEWMQRPQRNARRVVPGGLLGGTLVASVASAFGRRRSVVCSLLIKTVLVFLLVAPPCLRDARMPER